MIQNEHLQEEERPVISRSCTLQFFQSARRGTPASLAATSRPNPTGWRWLLATACTKREPSGRTTWKYSPDPTASWRAARAPSPCHPMTHLNAQDTLLTCNRQADGMFGSLQSLDL